jgi:hypothetical protein
VINLERRYNMCIAIYKPVGAELLSKDIYEQCWWCNQDGGSISYWDTQHKEWHVVKGLMEWEKWWETFEDMRNAESIGTDTAVFIHFRVGTAGKSFEAALTHPFPISDNLGDLQETMFAARDIIAHNGTIGPGNKSGTASDTMLAVLDYFEPLWNLTYYKSGKVRNEKLEMILKEVLDTANSRWFVANGPDVKLYGPWIYDKTYDTHFSNDDYENPYWEAYGCYSTGAPVGAWNGHFDRTFTAKYIRQGTIDIYLDKEGMWDWNAWRQMNDEVDSTSTVSAENSSASSHHPDACAYSDPPEKDGLILAVLDDDGTLHWEDSFEMDDDLLCCPDCASDDIVSYGGLNIADMACGSCGALFDAKTSEVFAYDKTLCEYEIGECMYCDELVFIEPGGNCLSCGAILDLKEAQKDD